MGCTIDHLCADLRVTVRQDFADARGHRHRAGETGVIRKIALDWPKQEICVEWQRDGKMETMLFELMAKTGPRNGHMKEFFEAGDLELPERKDRRKFVPDLGLVPTAPPELPEVSPGLIADAARAQEALQRVWALAGRRRFAEAEEQLRAVQQDPSITAGVLGGAAELHVFEQDGAVYEWLRDRAINCWYSWGSQATSGGDGAARMLEIGPAMDRFKKLDQWRAANAK